MSIDEPALRAAPVAAERVTLRRFNERKRRVWRNVALFVLATTAMVVLSMAHRDSQYVRTCQANFQSAVEALKAERGQHGLPLFLPFPKAGRSLRNHYRYAPQNVDRLGLVRSVVIWYCRRPHDFFLRTSGRHVVLYDGDALTLRWLSESEFQERLAETQPDLPAAP